MVHVYPKKECYLLFSKSTAIRFYFSKHLTISYTCDSSSTITTWDVYMGGGMAGSLKIEQDI